MFERKNSYFEYGQFLYKNYSTTLRNVDIKNQLVDFSKNIANEIFSLDENVHPRAFINNFVLHHYPNEVAIKSSFINNVLNRSNNHVVIFELNVVNSRVDLCYINRDSVAYEIKTELDTTWRLANQINDYFKVFEKVYLICSENDLEKMLLKVPDACGIYTYRLTEKGRYVFKRYRIALKSKELSSEDQLLSLTKRELQSYFCVKYGLKDDMVYSIMSIHSSKYINRMFKSILKDKYKERWEFLLKHKRDIYEIDYQWFYNNRIAPEIVYR